MNTNLLLAISVIMVGTILISINYSAISDFYTYSVPLNSFEVLKRPLDKNSDVVVKENVFYGSNFSDIIKKKDSECIATNFAHYCYYKPNLKGRDSGASEIVSRNNAINGEIHFDSIDKDTLYFTMKNVTKINNDSIRITFADKGISIGNSTFTKYKIPEFEFSATVKKFDTFISNCGNYEGTDVTLVQYLGITSIDGADYFMTWHTPAHSEQGISCDYPQIIKNSIGHNFGL